MKKIGMAVMLGLVILASAGAEGAVVDSKGVFSLQFTLAGLGTFGPKGVPIDMPGTASAATAYGIGGKYFVVDKLAVGAGLYLAGESTTLGATSDVDKSFSLGIRPFAAYTLAKKGPVALNVGGYLSFGLGGSEATPVRNTRGALALGGSLGAECFILNGVSLGAEYHAGIRFYRDARVNTATGVVTTTAITDYGTSSASVFLSFYF